MAGQVGKTGNIVGGKVCANVGGKVGEKVG